MSLRICADCGERVCDHAFTYTLHEPFCAIVSASKDLIGPRCTCIPRTPPTDTVTLPRLLVEGATRLLVHWRENDDAEEAEVYAVDGRTWTRGDVLAALDAALGGKEPSGG